MKTKSNKGTAKAQIPVLAAVHLKAPASWVLKKIRIRGSIVNNTINLPKERKLWVQLNLSSSVNAEIRLVTFLNAGLKCRAYIRWALVWSKPDSTPAICLLQFSNAFSLAMQRICYHTGNINNKRIFQSNSPAHNRHICWQLFIKRSHRDNLNAKKMLPSNFKNNDCNNLCETLKLWKTCECCFHRMLPGF
jgi:hypothetical protein